MPYQDPRHVDSPRGRWRLIEVLWDGGSGEDSLAIGMWDNVPRLAMRWNGDGVESPVGNPQSRGLPTWFMLPDWCYEGILDKTELKDKQLQRTKAILGV